MSAAGRSVSTIPQSVSASGGRYHFKDDWQFYDTLVTSFNYEDKLIDWEGKMLPGHEVLRARPRLLHHGNYRLSALSIAMATKIYDLKGNKTSGSSKPAKPSDSSDTLGRDSMTDLHFANFIAGIRKGEKLQRARLRRQCRCHHAATLQRRMGSQPDARPRHSRRQNPERPGEP